MYSLHTICVSFRLKLNHLYSKKKTCYFSPAYPEPSWSVPETASQCSEFQELGKVAEIRQAELKDKEREAAHLAGVLSALQVARTEHVAGDLAWVGTFARAVW